MRRRNFLAGMAAPVPLAAAQRGSRRATSAGPADTRWARSAARKREITKNVSWPSHEPLSFMLRRGTHPEDQPEIFERQHRPDNIRAMKEAGVGFARLHFYKGFGLEYEKADLEKTQRMADMMHQLGMKVSLYVAGTMFTETFYREVAEAVNWEQRDQNNHWVPYMQTQTFRHYACPNEPAYREYLKKVLRIGVQQIKAEQIFFDNVQLQPEPKSCRCPRCVRGFHDFLAKRYPTKEAAYRRFGLPDVAWIHVNEWDVYNTPDAVSAVDDPVLQEWIRYRCWSMAQHYNELCDYVKSLNPNISVGLNLKGIYGFNRMWLNGIYHSFYAGHCDFMPFDVNGMEARLDEKTGALIAEIRSYKLARRLEISCDDNLRDELNGAVHMAFNYQKEVPGFGTQGGPFLQGGANVFNPIAEFFREYNNRYLTHCDNVADVAVIRTWASMAYSIGPTLAPAILMEQVLIQHKVPFDLLYEEQLDRIDRYRAVILAGQECLSKEQIERLMAYASKGGVVIFTGNTGDYNEWRERRRVNPLRGRGGRFVYVPAIIPAGSKIAAGGEAENPEIVASSGERSHRFSPEHWLLPQNHREILRAITSAIGPLSIQTEAPVTTVMEILNRKLTNETIVQFINFDRQRPVQAFAADVRKQFSGPVKSVQYFTPDADNPVRLEFRENGGRVGFAVPTTRLYGMVVISHA